MTDSELNRAVALTTGESMSRIKQMGFGLADPESADFDPEPSDVDRFLDWDAADSNRLRLFPL